MTDSEGLDPYKVGELWKRNMGCTSDHLGDAPAIHSGGTNIVGITHYERHYSDGCVHIVNFRTGGRWSQAVAGRRLKKWEERMLMALADDLGSGGRE